MNGMRRNRAITIFGIIVAVTPFLGFPSGFKNFLFVLFGLLISVLAYLALREQKHLELGTPGETFTESFLKEEADRQRPQDYSATSPASDSHETL